MSRARLAHIPLPDFGVPDAEPDLPARVYRARAARLDIPYQGLCAEPFARRVVRGTADRFWSTLATRQRLRAWVGNPIADQR